MPLFPAADSELEAIATLVNRAYRAGEGWTHEGDYLDGERTDATTLRQDLAQRPDAALLTFRDDAAGDLLGVVWLEPAGGDTWYLGMLTVRPDLQNRQLGRSLLAEAERVAAQHGARRIRMTVIGIRDSLIAWYARRGFQPTGEAEAFPYGDARFGVPRRDDLVFVVLERVLPSDSV